MATLAEFVAVNPMTLVCPLCKAVEGHSCETAANPSEPVHLERIAAALKIDVAAKEKLVRSLPSLWE
jgi:hypothetical protein